MSIKKDLLDFTDICDDVINMIVQYTHKDYTQEKQDVIEELNWFMYENDLSPSWVRYFCKSKKHDMKRDKIYGKGVYRSVMYEIMVYRSLKSSYKVKSTNISAFRRITPYYREKDKLEKNKHYYRGLKRDVHKELQTKDTRFRRAYYDHYIY